MARDDVTSTKLTTIGQGGADIADVAGVAINTTNNTRVLCNKVRKTFIVITNTSAGTPTVTVPKGPGASDVPADFVTTAFAATTGVRVLGPFNGRYVQADGGIYLNFTAGHTGIVKAYEVP